MDIILFQAQSITHQVVLFALLSGRV